MSRAKGNLVIIDDDAEMRSLLTDFFSNDGYEVLAFPLASLALEKLKAKDFKADLVISDIKMPQMTGLEFVKELKDHRPDLPVILITAFGSVDTAIEAIRVGAYDYVIKPFQLSEMQVTAERAIEYKRLQQDNSILRKEIKNKWAFENIIGKSKAMKTVFDMIVRVSGSNSSVLVTGESGTGKEVVARAIHNNSPRANKPFIAVNCSAIPENLLESELFGHAKGSFTGAIQKKVGLFEEANGGTIFLDEIGDMEPSLQAKLLRVLQERQIRPVGDTQMRQIDVRIIAATHKDIKAAIKDGRFREDLYYRLSVIPIHIPALRHRKEDIPLLAEHFLNKYSATNNSKKTGFAEAALSRLVNQRWEGNVRELENVIERAVVLSRANTITLDDLPSLSEVSVEDFYGASITDMPTIDQLEKRYIQYILERTGGRKSKAAQILGINRRTLYRKEIEYGFSSPPENHEMGSGE